MERSTHADLAYVLFDTPMPIALEEELLGALADLARVSPDSVYCRWPERNAELCARLAAAAAGFVESQRGVDGEESRVPLTRLLASVESALADDVGPALLWCLDCSACLVAEPRGHGACRVVTLIDAAPGRRLELFRSFLAADPRPPDPRLRAREGDAVVLQRTERGDFGAAYQRSWRRFVGGAARAALATDVRATIARQRAAGMPIDYYLRSGKAFFVWQRPA